MKKFLISLSFIFLSFAGYSQNYFKAYRTEMYTYNEQTEEWDLYQKNSDMNITIVVEEEFLSVHAKSPSMYKIYGGSKEDISTKSLVGYRYKARDLRQEVGVVIDIVRSTENSISMISVINKTEKYNLRFYIKPIEE